LFKKKRDKERRKKKEKGKKEEKNTLFKYMFKKNTTM
jgi:hypothetical protein